MFPVIGPNPVGRQKSNPTTSKSPSLPAIANDSKTILISLATIAVELHTLLNQEDNNKTLQQLIKSLKAKYNLDNNKISRLEDIVNDIPNDLEPDNEKLTLDVGGYVHRELGLDFIKYTHYEVKRLMLNILQKKEKKDAGCKNLGVGTTSINNHFKDISMNTLGLEEEKVGVKK